MSLKLFNLPAFNMFDTQHWVVPQTTRASQQQQLASLGAADVVEKDNEYLVVVDTPGLKSSDVKVPHCLISHVT